MAAALFWVALAVLFTVGEIAVAGTFFLLPFAAGAAVAAGAAFVGFGLLTQVLAALVTSAGAASLLIPYGRRLDRSSPHHGIGANRWVGKEGLVLADIPGRAGEVGRIRIEREEWVAESGAGIPIRAGSTVLVSRVDGTRMVVLPLELEQGA